MAKVTVRVVGRPILKTAVGDTLELSPRDADILERLGRVEIVPPAEDVDFTPSEKLDEALTEQSSGKRTLDTPEGELQTVAHAEPPKKRRRSTRRKK